MMTKWLEFPPLAEFVDRAGIVRAIHGCTLIGRFEFIDRQQQIKAIIDRASADETWQNLYLNNTEFRNAIDRCLWLNGLEPGWLTPPLIEQLLFARLEDNEWKEGWLTTLNNRDSKPSKGESVESTLPNLLALVSLSCESLNEAIELASNTPGNLLLDIIESMGEMSKTPEDRATDKQDKNLEVLKANYSNLMGK